MDRTVPQDRRDSGDENGRREPFELGAGDLRFRRIYAGGDRLLLTRRTIPADAEKALT